MDWFRTRPARARRGSDHSISDLQYYTPRGVIPLQVVDDQAFDIPDIASRRNERRYPHQFRNLPELHPDGEYRRLFSPEELRDDDELLFEFPVIPPGRPPFNMRRAPTGLNQLNLLPTRTARDLADNPPNDPGPFRGVVPAYPNRRGDEPRARRPPIGLIYHPEGWPERFQRASVEPLSPEGRRLLRRHTDDLGFRPLQRSGTWPPRDEDAEDLTLFETRYEAVVPGSEGGISAGTDAKRELELLSP